MVNNVVFVLMAISKIPNLILNAKNVAFNVRPVQIMPIIVIHVI